jgi:hypothetical protein
VAGGDYTTMYVDHTARAKQENFFRSIFKKLPPYVYTGGIRSHDP